MFSDDQNNGMTMFADEDEDSPSRQLASVVAPASAQSLVGMVGPPPDSPPASQPGVSTPRTGNLAAAPSQAVPKNRDTGTGYNSGVSNPLNGGNVSSMVSPVQPVQQASSLRSPAVAPAPLMPAAGSLQPVMPAAKVDTRNVIIRDMNGTSVGTAPRNVTQALQPGIARALAARMGNGPAVPQAPLNNQGLAATQQLRQQAYNASPVAAAVNAPAPLMPGSVNGTSLQPAIPAASPQQVQPDALNMQTQQAQQKLTDLQNQPYGGSQIKNRWGRIAARMGDVALSDVAPGVAQYIPQTTLGHQRQVGIQQGVVGNLQGQQTQRAQQEDTAAQIAERQAQGQRATAQANYYNPEPMSAGQAQSLGHPEWEGLKLDARDAERLVGGAAHNDTTLQTHFGGQQRKLSAEDAAAIKTPSLEGASMSNDEYQRLLQGAQHNQQWNTNNQRTTGQSDVNNRRTNATRVTTTGMRDDTSEDNSNRAHPGGGAAKPIPPAVRDRIESQKATAINKARGQFDNGESSMDDYLDNWQQAQNDYEDRLSAQTGGPIPHTDVRSNVDAKGNWTGNRGTAQSAKQPGFVTQKGNKVALGDPVNVNGRRGVVTGFNSQTGKAQVRWAGAN
jgi:hypothetical protein